uniref:TPR_REGION domain-containing protein n=1 Tax=Macrostomum lignano TaxID=282301 RepID=A0A1I8F2G3_9PLAT
DSDSDGFSGGGGDDSRDSDSDGGSGGGSRVNGGFGGVGGSEDPVSGSISAWVGLTATPPNYSGGVNDENEVRKCLNYFKKIRQQVGSFDKAPLKPLDQEAEKRPAAASSLQDRRKAIISSIFDVDPASQSILGKRRRSDTPPPPNPTSESNKTRVVAVAHAGGLNLRTLLRRAKSHKQQLEAAIKSAQPDSAKRHFLHAGLLFLAGCWADDERRRASAAAGDSALAAAAAPTRQTYREIATFVRQFARQLMRQSSNGGGNGRKPTAKDSLAELSMLMLLSVVEYRQYYCYRQELANHSAAMKNGNLAAEQREQFLGHLLHLYHATETWAHMMRNRDKLLAESPDLVRLEEEAVRLSGFRPAGPSDRLSHLLAYLQAAADVLGSSSAAGGLIVRLSPRVRLSESSPPTAKSMRCLANQARTWSRRWIVADPTAESSSSSPSAPHPDSQLVDVDPLLLSCRLSARHRTDFDSGSSQSTSTRVRLTGSTVYSQPAGQQVALLLVLVHQTVQQTPLRLRVQVDTLGLLNLLSGCLEFLPKLLDFSRSAGRIAGVSISRMAAATTGTWCANGGWRTRHRSRAAVLLHHWDSRVGGGTAVLLPAQLHFEAASSRSPQYTCHSTSLLSHGDEPLIIPLGGACLAPLAATCGSFGADCPAASRLAPAPSCCTWIGLPGLEVLRSTEVRYTEP